MAMYDVPNPYDTVIQPILNTFITNPLKAKVKLSKTRWLEPNERISWLELIKLKHGIIKK
jgi:hypothetical protein